MRQVKVHFSLVGKTNECVRALSVQDDVDVSTETILEQIKRDVRFHFGERNIVVHQEKLMLMGSLPDFYAASWFVSEDEGRKGTDLVVLAHGSSMKSAQDAVFDAVRMMDWDEVASSYGD